MPVDCSIPMNMNELGEVDPSLGGVESLLTQPYPYDASWLQKEISELSANLAECLLEKSLLEEQINQEKHQKSEDDELPVRAFTNHINQIVEIYKIAFR